MQISYPNFDQFVTNYFPDVYRLCFLLTREASGAWQTAFQTFLYMGTIKEPFADPEDEQNTLFGWCVRTCTDHYYRKIRRRKPRNRFEQDVPFPISEDLWKLLGMPFRKRAEIFFTDYLGFTAERAGLVLSGNVLNNHVQHKMNVSGVPPEQCGWQEAIASIRTAGDGASQLLGEICLRFEERNVPLENKLRNIRSWWDHAVIWIAAAIVLLFAAAAWYTAQIVV